MGKKKSWKPRWRKLSRSIRHASHASLSARGRSLKNLFFLPVFETGHPLVPLHPSTRFGQRRSRTKDGAESEKSVSRVSRVARTAIPNDSPPISGAGIGSYFARNDEQTRDEIAKSKRERERERARWARIPPTIPSGCVWQRAKGPFHRFALFSARLFARPARNQPLHCPRGQYIYHEERAYPFLHPPSLPPRVSKFSKIRADRFSFLRTATDHYIERFPILE